MAKRRAWVVLKLTLVLMLWSKVPEARSWSGNHRGEEGAAHFSNEWVVRVEGGQLAARALAEELGYNYQGQVLGFEDTYRMVKEDHPRVHKRAHSQLTRRLASDARVRKKKDPRST